MQTNIRKRLKQLIEFYGTSQSFISKHTGISKATINMFIKEERNLSENFECKLDEFLKERNC